MYEKLFVHTYNLIVKLNFMKVKMEANQIVVSAEVFLSAISALWISYILIISGADVDEMVSALGFGLCVVFQVINYFLFSYKEKYKKILKIHNKEKARISFALIFYFSLLFMVIGVFIFL